jgi:hypothetical protein
MIKLVAEKDKTNPSIVDKHDIFLARGKGHKKVFICSAYKSYISMHPYHSFHDISVWSTLSLFKQAGTLCIINHYYEENSAGTITEHTKTFYKSLDNGEHWEEIKQVDEMTEIAGYSLIDTLIL